MIALWILLGLLLVLALALVVLAYVTFCVACRRDYRVEKTEQGWHDRCQKHGMNELSRRYKEGKEWFATLPVEELTQVSKDGLTLCARLYKAPAPSKGTMVLSHGFHSFPEFDFSISGRFFLETLGLDLLAVDQRAHGKSQGKYLTYGAFEQEDICNWCKIAEEKQGKDKPLYLYGVSMGCAAALLSAVRPDRPESLKGIVADCGYASLSGELTHVLKDRLRLPAGCILKLTDLFTRSLAHFSLYSINVEEVAEKLTAPTLFIHGTGDDFIPPSNSRAVYDSCPAPKELLLIDGAGHGLSWPMGTPRCEEAFRAFFHL